MEQIIFRPRLYKFDDTKSFANEFHLCNRDLVLTNRYIFDPYFDSNPYSTQLIYQEDFGGGEPLGSEVERIGGDGEAEAEVLVGGFLYLVTSVPEHYLLGLCLVEPAATTVAQELQCLGEELTVVGHATGVDGRG